MGRRQSAITRSARGEECTLRVPLICNWDSSTTVWAHIKRPWQGGTVKPNDEDGVYACSACHNALDGRDNRIGRELMDTYLVDAMLRTQKRRRELAEELKGAAL